MEWRTSVGGKTLRVARRRGSVFDLPAQHLSVEGKIVAALDRLARALRVLLWERATAHGLSPIQIQFLVHLRHHPEQACRVSSLAREFGLTQPTASDAIGTLEAKGLLTRVGSRTDGRVVILRLTPRGARVAGALSHWGDVIAEAVRPLPPEDTVRAMRLLMHLIERLQHAGIITSARMCPTCRFFRPDVHPGTRTPHHCQLLGEPLADRDLRVDCSEHAPATA